MVRMTSKNKPVVMYRKVLIHIHYSSSVVNIGMKLRVKSILSSDLQGHDLYGYNIQMCFFLRNAGRTMS